MTLTMDDLKQRLPHRYENLLLDSCTKIEDSETNTATFSINIGPEDPLNRMLFSKQKTSSQHTILEATFMEILALASISSSGTIREDQLIFFTSISHFTKTGDFRVGEHITGSTT